MKLSNENIEEYILLLVDDELNEAEERAVMAYIERHEAYKPLLETYLATRLDGAETFVFPDKEQLLKPESQVLPLKKTTGMPLKLAAAVVVLIGMSMALTLIFSDKKTKDNDSGEWVSKQKTMPPTQSSKSTTGNDSVLLAKSDKEKDKQGKRGVQKNQKASANSSQRLVAGITGTPNKRETTPTYLENTPINKVPIDVGVGVEPQTLVMMEQRAGGMEAIERKQLPEWLPVNEENLQGINDLVAHIQVLKERIQEKTQSLKKATFVLNIGGKEILIGK